MIWRQQQQQMAKPNRAKAIAATSSYPQMLSSDLWLAVLRWPGQAGLIFVVIEWEKIENYLPKLFWNIKNSKIENFYLYTGSKIHGVKLISF